jgi:TusA-related sulfurtransferase
MDSFTTDMNVCYEVLMYLAGLMNKLPEGDVLEFITSDPNAEAEIRPWIELREYTLVSVDTQPDGKKRFLIRR